MQSIWFKLQHFAEESDTGVKDEGAADPDTSKAEGEEKDVSKVIAARLGHERKKLEAELESKYTDDRRARVVMERAAKASNMSLSEYIDFTAKTQEDDDLEEESFRTGKSPDVLKLEKEKAEALARVAKTERKEKLSIEEREMVADPVLGKFVTEHLKSIRDLAEEADVPMKAALAVLAGNMLPDILKKTDPNYHKDTIIKEYIEGLRKGQKPLDISGAGTLIEKSTPKTFAEAFANSKSIIEASQRAK